jgi:hypothetical protein
LVFRDKDNSCGGSGTVPSPAQRGRVREGAIPQIAVQNVCD